MSKKGRKVAYLFPGQGSQRVGMGQDLYEDFPRAREVYQRADDLLRFPLSRLCFEGPEEELRRTSNAQPALLVTSLACLAAAREQGLEEGLGEPLFVAGHSLGEYTSLVVAGAVSFPTALRLVRVRGKLMEAAGQRYPGGMLALLGVDLETATEVCQQSGAQIANINCPGQIVISGTPEALEMARELVQERKGKAIPLPVSGAFHSSLMSRAVRGLVRLVMALRFRRPRIPVVANTTARPVTRVREMKQELCAQLCQCVHWQGSVEFIAAQGVDTFVEIGPGQVLTGMVRRIVPEAQTVNINDASSIGTLTR